MKKQSTSEMQPLDAEHSLDGSTLHTIEAGETGPAQEVGVCIDDQHPVLAGRVLCRFDRANGEVSEHWLPCLWNTVPRRDDRVLVLRALGAPLGLVVGVVDGFRRRVEPDLRAAHVRQLGTDEAVRIEAADGRGLLEVRASEQGCSVRLLSKDAKLESEGALTIEANTVAIRARQGAVTVQASEDVALRGEQIHLN